MVVVCSEEVRSNNSWGTSTAPADTVAVVEEDTIEKEAKAVESSRRRETVPPLRAVALLYCYYSW